MKKLQFNSFGLLGGSFDPPHYGHLKISKIALEKLPIKKVVWIVNKKNPFKGDLNHLHHKVENYVKNKNLTVLITICLCVLPSFLIFFELKTYNILIINLIIYFSLILFLKNKKRL